MTGLCHILRRTASGKFRTHEDFSACVSAGRPLHGAHAAIVPPKTANRTQPVTEDDRYMMLTMEAISREAAPSMADAITRRAKTAGLYAGYGSKLRNAPFYLSVAVTEAWLEGYDEARAAMGVAL
jgi:hypothetical protein